MLERRPADGWKVCPRCQAVIAQGDIARACGECEWDQASCSEVLTLRSRQWVVKAAVVVALVLGVVAFVSPAVDVAAVRAGDRDATMFVMLLLAAVAAGGIRVWLLWRIAPRVLFNRAGVWFDGSGLPRDCIRWHEFAKAEVDLARGGELWLLSSDGETKVTAAVRDLGGAAAARECADAINAGVAARE